VVVPSAGRYEVYLKGAFRGRVRLLVDGREVSDERHMLSHAGQYEPLADIDLAAGRHALVLDYGESVIAPGSGGSPFTIGPLFFAPATSSGVEVISPARTQALCGTELDWIEAVGP
jgi:hypothetical protein